MKDRSKDPLHHELVLYHGATEKEDALFNALRICSFFLFGGLALLFLPASELKAGRYWVHILVPAPTQSKLLLF